MANTSDRPNLDSLPQEVLEMILQKSRSRKNLLDLCLVSKKMRFAVQPLLYRSVRILNGRVSSAFWRSVTQDTQKATWVQKILFRYRELRHENQDFGDMETLTILSNIRNLKFDSPIEAGKCLVQLLPQILESSSPPFLQNLTSCRLSFRNGKEPFWVANEALLVLYLPSLQRLDLEFVKLSSFPQHRRPSTAYDLAPLSVLLIKRCDIPARGLEELFSVRQTRMLSFVFYDCPWWLQLQMSRDKLAAYEPALRRCAGTLEMLEFDRLWDEPERSPLSLSRMTTLRIVEIIPWLLLGDVQGQSPGHELSYFAERLPPNLEIISFWINPEDYSEPEWMILQDALCLLTDAKDGGLAPHLRWIEICETTKTEVADNMSAPLLERLEKRGFIRWKERSRVQQYLAGNAKSIRVADEEI